MGTTIAPVATVTAQSSAATRSFTGANDRRRRKRAKISAQVQVRFAAPSGAAEEICTSVDVSRDGLLFLSTRSTYAVGQSIDVTFPYSAAATALNKPEPAEVVRVSEQPGNRFAVAVQFVAARSGVSRAAASTSPAPATQTQQSVVLAVESDQRTAEIMRTTLQPDGYTVIVVASANEALEVLKSTIPAVFVAEVEAKDMSGQDLCLIVKRNERLQRVPVILLTRSAQPADYATSHQLGAVVCMAKPFKPERLLHVVRLVAPPPQQKMAYARSSSSVERAF
ncbi:MAG TPA: response regulator [Candidatus Acidoferrales bacterium]|nr:response regulator [Candidatus Acidoferrales bacterium]